MKCQSLKASSGLVYYHLESVLILPPLECGVGKTLVRLQKPPLDSHCYFPQIEMRKLSQALHESIEGRLLQPLSSVGSMDSVHIRWSHVSYSIPCWRDLTVYWYWSTGNSWENPKNAWAFYRMNWVFLLRGELNGLCVRLSLIFACSHPAIYGEPAHGAFLCGRFCWTSHFQLSYRALPCTFGRILKSPGWGFVPVWLGGSLACDIESLKFNASSRTWHTLLYSTSSSGSHNSFYYTIKQNNNATNHHFGKEILEKWRR